MRRFLPVTPARTIELEGLADIMQETASNQDIDVKRQIWYGLLEAETHAQSHPGDAANVVELSTDTEHQTSR